MKELTETQINILVDWNPYKHGKKLKEVARDLELPYSKVCYEIRKIKEIRPDIWTALRRAKQHREAREKFQSKRDSSYDRRRIVNRKPEIRYLDPDKELKWILDGSMTYSYEFPPGSRFGRVPGETSFEIRNIKKEAQHLPEPLKLIMWEVIQLWNPLGDDLYEGQISYRLGISKEDVIQCINQFFYEHPEDCEGLLWFKNRKYLEPGVTREEIEQRMDDLSSWSWTSE